VWIFLRVIGRVQGGCVLGTQVTRVLIERRPDLDASSTIRSMPSARKLAPKRMLHADLDVDIG
jgi:hypothetical protein